MSDKVNPNIWTVLGGIPEAVKSIFDSSGFWEVRGKKFDLRDKKYEDRRAVIEKEAELEILRLIQEADEAKAWAEIRERILERLVKEPEIILPERRIRRILKVARRRFNKRIK